MIESVVSQLVIMLIIIFMGFLIKKKNFISDDGEEGIQTILLKVTFPCMLLMALQRGYTEKLNKIFLTNFISGIIVVLACYVIFFLIMKYIMRLDNKKLGVFIIGSVFGNVSFMGIPIARALYGEEAVLISVAVIFAYNLMFFSAGVMACHFGDRKKFDIFESLKRTFLNLPMISIILGYVLFRCSVRLPDILGEALNAVGSSSNVIALFIVGFALAKVKVKELADINIFIVIGFGLILAPIIARLLGGIFLKDEISLGVIVMAAASPAATSISALASSEGRDGVMASKIIFMSTLLCVATIPIIIRCIL